VCSDAEVTAGDLLASSAAVVEGVLYENKHGQMSFHGPHVIALA
jgi:hypothetical protein